MDNKKIVNQQWIIVWKYIILNIQDKNSFIPIVHYMKFIIVHPHN